MQFCVKAWLVSLEFEIPSDPAIAYTGGQPRIGCNHLVCSQCGFDVRHADHRSTTSNPPPPRAKLEELYDSSEPETSPLLDGTPLHAKSRAYFCRCQWLAIDLSGARAVDDIDPMWACAGHGAATDGSDADPSKPVPAAHVEARKQADAAVAAHRLATATIKLRYAVGVAPEFSTTAELRDSLLASYPDAAAFGKPVVAVDRESTVPAWGWVIELLKKRSDWLPSIGIALQHAARDGGDLARRALFDLMGDFHESVALLPWTAPLARTWSDLSAERTATGFGEPEFRFDSIARDQERYLAAARTSSIVLLKYGKNGDLIAREPFATEADLQAVLDESARAGEFPGGDKGPWSWVAFQLLIKGAWMRPAFVHLVTTLDTSITPHLYALLDWFSEESDLWQFVALLDGWIAKPPPWWGKLAETKPKGWKRDLRSAYWPNVKTLGDVVQETRKLAAMQVATPPVDDLPLLYPISS